MRLPLKVFNVLRSIISLSGLPFSADAFFSAFYDRNLIKTPFILQEQFENSFLKTETRQTVRKKIAHSKRAWGE